MCSSEEITDSHTTLWDHQRPRLDLTNTCSLLFSIFFFPQHDLIIFVPAEISSWPSSILFSVCCIWISFVPWSVLIVTITAGLYCSLDLGCQWILARIFFVGGQNHHYQNCLYNVIEALSYTIYNSRSWEKVDSYN